MGLMVQNRADSKIEAEVVQFVAKQSTTSFQEAVRFMQEKAIEATDAKAMIWSMLAAGRLEYTPEWRLRAPSPR